MQLETYLRDAARERFRWGETDCAMFVADWVRVSTGRDPIVRYRGAYTGEMEAVAIAGRMGLPALVDRTARRFGLSRTRQPSAGAIGVIVLNGLVLSAIRTRHGWAMRAASGVLFVRADQVRVVSMWALP